MKFIEFGKTLWKDESGATAIEYGLLAALIAVGIITAVSVIGDEISGAFDSVADTLQAEDIQAAD
jgi:pilus assembly protein Flp/PilA